MTLYACASAVASRLSLVSTECLVDELSIQTPGYCSRTSLIY